MTEIGLAGDYDARGNACLAFHLCGVRHELPGVQYTGIIDTGFTGFLQIPLGVAFELALPLEGTTSVMLANGSTATKLTAAARATVCGQSRFGIVILEAASPEILIGMDFLRRFDVALFVTRDLVGIVSEETLRRAGITNPGK